MNTLRAEAIERTGELPLSLEDIHGPLVDFEEGARPKPCAYGSPDCTIVHRDEEGAVIRAVAPLASLSSAPVAPMAVEQAWMPIETAPWNTYVLLHFPGPFLDTECTGIAYGKRTAYGWWLTAIWASTVDHQEPDFWMPAPPLPVVIATMEKAS